MSNGKIIVRHHVQFYKHHFPFSTINTPTPTAYNFLNNDITPYLAYQMHQHATPSASPVPCPQITQSRPTSHSPPYPVQLGPRVPTSTTQRITPNVLFPGPSASPGPLSSQSHPPSSSHAHPPNTLSHTPPLSSPLLPLTY